MDYKNVSNKELLYNLNIDGNDNLAISLDLKTPEEILESWKESDEKINEIINNLYGKSDTYKNNKYLVLSVLEKKPNDNNYLPVKGMQDYVFVDLEFLEYNNVCIQKDVIIDDEQKIEIENDKCNEFYNISNVNILPSVNKVSITHDFYNPSNLILSWDYAINNSSIFYDLEYKEKSSKTWELYRGSYNYYEISLSDENEYGENIFDKNKIYDFRLIAKQDINTGDNNENFIYSHPFEFEIDMKGAEYPFDLPLFVDVNEPLEVKILKKGDGEYNEKIKNENLWLYV